MTEEVYARDVQVGDVLRLAHEDVAVRGAVRAKITIRRGYNRGRKVPRIGLLYMGESKRHWVDASEKMRKVVT